jgi:hypothetical protein
MFVQKQVDDGGRLAYRSLSVLLLMSAVLTVFARK